MDLLARDVRETFRSLGKNRGFALTAILTIGLGIGINTAMFSVLHGTLLAPLPYADPERITFMWKDMVVGDYRRAPLSPPEIADLRRASSLHEEIAGIYATTGILLEGGRPEPVRVGIVSSNFLSLFGVPAVRGRLFTEADGKPGAPPSVVISAALWQSRFGGSDVIGRRLRLDSGWGGMRSGTFTVVGIMPPRFELLLPPESRVPRVLDAWIPLQFDFATAPRAVSYLNTVGRVARGASVAAAQEQIERVAQSPQYAGASRRFFAVPLHADLVKGARRALLTLQAAVGLVLLIGCAGVAGLQVVRAHARRREIAIRAALGAPRSRLLRLLLTESLLLAAVGGVLGVALAYLALRLLPLLDAGALPRLSSVTLNGPTLAFTTIASLASGVLFGIAPLFESSRKDVVAVIGEGGRAGASPAALRVRKGLVLAEIGLSVVLLIGAGLLVRTFVELLHVDPGYRSDRVLTFQLTLPAERYGPQPALSRFARELEAQLRTVAGVEAAGAINQLPLDDSVPNATTSYRTRATADEQDAPNVDARFVTAGYFDAVRPRLVTGRWFTEQDDEQHPLVLVVDELLAETAWPGQSALDKELSVVVWTGAGFGPRWGRVVGVVAHARHHRLTEDVRGEIFIPLVQAGRNRMAVALRTPLDADRVMPEVTRRLHAIDPNLAPARVESLDQYVERSRASARLNMMLATAFAGLALLLACLSLYGVISYSVSQRASELAVRAALGARAGELVTLVVGQAVLVTAAGVLLGLAASAATARSLRSLLFGVTAFDPMIYAGVPIAVVGTALLASYVPARRAARIDPAVVLRSQ